MKGENTGSTGLDYQPEIQLFWHPDTILLEMKGH